MDFKRRTLWSEVGQRCLAYGRRTATNPQWLIMAILGRFAIVRSLILRCSPVAPVNCPLVADSLFTNLELEQTLTTLNQDGVYVGINLPAATLHQITTALPEDRPCKTNYGYGAQYVTSKNLVLENTALQDAVEVVRQDPVLVHLAAAYMRAEPLYSGCRVWWSFAVHDCPLTAAQPVHRFHYDLYDYRCLRFFFYLTDVALDSGPHQYVRGSHRQRQLGHGLSLLKACPDHKIVRYYGSEQVVTVQGPAGMGFAEDPFCFHKGTPPQGRDRLIMMVQYVAHDYGVSNNPNDPFAFWKAE